MKRLILIFYILLSFNVCFAQMVVQNRDVKQPAETKLFISGNHLTPDFEDGSTSNNTITKYADAKTVTETSTTNPKYFPVGNDKGIYFDGTGDCLTTTHASDFDFGTGDFTIDAWVFVNKTAAINTIYSGSTDDGERLLRSLLRTDTNKLATWSGAAAYEDSYTWALNTWYHIAVIKSSNVIRHYVNGTQIGVDHADTRSLRLYPVVNIGVYYSNYYPYNGFLQNIRISKGIARWTSNFIPPALNSTYTTDSYTKLYIKGHDKAVNTTAMTDDSGTSKTITTYGDTKIGYSRGTCAYFDGTGDYLSCPLVGSNDYTKTTSVELWYYPIAITSSSGYVHTLIARGYRTNGDFNLLAISDASSEDLYFQKYSTTGSTVYRAIIDRPIVAGKWHHIVVEYETGTTTTGNINFWINGVKSTQTKIETTSTMAANTLTMIGLWNGYALNTTYGCYIYGIKVSEDYITPYYTSNFTPPETEPTADQYTKLLLKTKKERLIDSSSNPKTINRYGDAGAIAVNNFGGTNVISKNTTGTDRYMTVSNHVDLQITGAFTYDFWVYFTETPTATYIFSCNADSSGNYFTGDLSMSSNTSQNKWWFYPGNNGPSSCSVAPSVGVWYHCALTRDASNNVRSFLNGVMQAGSPYFYTNSTAQTQPVFFFRRTYPTHQSSYLMKFKDIRITKGKALWTSNFTPPRRSGAF